MPHLCLVKKNIIILELVYFKMILNVRIYYYYYYYYYHFSGARKNNNRVFILCVLLLKTALIFFNQDRIMSSII